MNNYEVYWKYFGESLTKLIRLISKLAPLNWACVVLISFFLFLLGYYSYSYIPLLLSFLHVEFCPIDPRFCMLQLLYFLPDCSPFFIAQVIQTFFLFAEMSQHSIHPNSKGPCSCVFFLPFHWMLSWVQLSPSIHFVHFQCCKLNWSF